jgi:antitoxin component YwqK of YwqJK toxin-antitoxin module
MKLQKRILVLFLVPLFILQSCSEDEPVKKRSEKKENLVEIIDGYYHEYYPGKKKIKFKGRQDDNKQRHGKWTFFSPNGEELSITHYIHGKREGHSIVKYPTGVIHYIGEYQNDMQIGIWKIYNEQGVLLEEKNFDLLTK